MRSFVQLAVLCAASIQAVAQVVGLGYRISPTANYVRLSDASGLNDGVLYGGAGAISFGEFVELAGRYQRFGDFGTSF